MTFKIIQWLNRKTKSNTKVHNTSPIPFLQEKKMVPLFNIFPPEKSKNVSLPTPTF